VSSANSLAESRRLLKRSQEKFERNKQEISGKDALEAEKQRLEDEVDGKVSVGGDLIK
jgi:hypothetical protein